MYRFSPSNSDYGRFIQRTQLNPLIERGGSAWFCCMTFSPLRNGIPRSIADEHFPKRIIVPFMITLAREFQCTVTPFVGWWNYGTSKAHHTHFHPVIHLDTGDIPDKVVQRTILSVWTARKHSGRINKCERFNPSMDGLAYVYGQHQRRDEPFWEHPFEPPICHKTGKPLPPHSSLEGFLRGARKRPSWKPAKQTRPTVIRRAKSS